MKYVNKLWLMVAAAGFAACAETDVDDYAVEKPENVSQYEQLFDYDGLKTYVNRTTDPNFKMGGGVTASEFTKKELVYALAKVNYDEVTAGNAMKYASCVNENGEMDFSSVNAFISAAKDAGLTIYGHTLAWHSQQQPKYLNGLLADKELPVEEIPDDEKQGVLVDVLDTKVDFSKMESYTMWHAEDVEEIKIVDGKLVIKNSAATDNWKIQYFTADNVKTIKDGTHKVIMRIRSTEGGEGTMHMAFGGWSETVQKDITFSGDWQNVEVTFPNMPVESAHLLCQTGAFVGTIEIEWVEIYHQEEVFQVAKELYANDFEGGEVLGGWGNNSTRTIVEDGGSKVMKMTNPSAVNSWEAQAAVDVEFPIKQVSMSMKIKGSAAGSIGAGFQHKADYSGCGNFPNIDFTTEWQEVTVKCTPQAGADRMTLNYGAFAGDIYIDDFRMFYMDDAAPAEPFSWVNVVDNTDCEGTENKNYVTRIKGNADINSEFADGEGVDGGRAIKIVTAAKVDNPWDNQFFITNPDHVWAAGDEYRFSMKVRSAVPTSVSSQEHAAPGSYLSGMFNFNTTTEWTEVTKEGTIQSDGMYSIAFNLNDGDGAANTFYFDDVHFEYKHNGNTIPLTPEEKKENLTKAMEAWIAGMMNACGGYVTSWDVVNEAISGGNPDDEGVYALQHDNGDKNNFFWQDYLGDEDYVRIAVRAARESFAASLPEGSTVTPDDLKLFINDYNLESDWDNNQKLKSLIAWIGRWEADGVTKIDGIGTQMHISYYEDAATQQSKQAAIENMFRLLAASGKLVKITELDMGYVKKGESEGAKTEDLTYEQHQQMAEYYKFIVKKYFEIIPAAQRYGITNWAITDSPADSGWRGGEPIGLWDKNYLRKPAFAGFADGLAGK